MNDLDFAMVSYECIGCTRYDIPLDKHFNECDMHGQGIACCQDCPGYKCGNCQGCDIFQAENIKGGDEGE